MSDLRLECMDPAQHPSNIIQHEVVASFMSQKIMEPCYSLSQEKYTWEFHISFAFYLKSILFQLNSFQRLECLWGKPNTAASKTHRWVVRIRHEYLYKTVLRLQILLVSEPFHPNLCSDKELDKELLRAISIIALILEGDYLWLGKGSPLPHDFLGSDPVHMGYETGWRVIIEDTQLHNWIQFNIIRKGSAALISVWLFNIMIN